MSSRSGGQEPEVDARRRRIAEIFGDVLPATTSDERDDNPRGASELDGWYRDNRPPHHDRD